MSRFKGLGEMMPAQLKDTTMSPATRTLIRVTVTEDAGETSELVERLMGKKPELRFQYIEENARFLPCNCRLHTLKNSGEIAEKLPKNCQYSRFLNVNKCL